MSGAVLGAIEIQMLLDNARFASDIRDAGRSLDQGLTQMKNSATSAVSGLLTGLSVGAFAGWIKGAIDAADAAKEFSQKTGVATQDVAGLQLAFRQGGVDSASLQLAMGKLSKQMVEGNATFQKLGITTRNTDGSLRSVKDVMYDTSDALTKLKDGAYKSSVAQNLMGKSAAALIPTLNDGSKALRHYADQAERLGLQISKETADAADKFNDQLDSLKAKSSGAALPIANELLPTLNALASSLLETGIAAISGRKEVGIFTLVVAGVVEAFSVMGLELGFMFKAIVGEFATIGKQLAAYATGNFDEARRLGEDWTAQAAAMRAEVDLHSSSIVNARKIEALAAEGIGQNEPMYRRLLETRKALTKGEIDGSDASKAAESAAKKAAAELAKLIKAGQEYLIGVNEQYGAVMRSVSLGRDLTEGERELVKLEEQLAKGKFILTDAERLSVELKLREIDAIKEQRKQAEDYSKTLAAVAQHSSKWNDEQIKLTESLRAGNVQLIEENAKLGMTEAAWGQRQQAVLLSQAADLEWQAANQGGNYQLEEQARLLRDRATLLSDGVVLKEAKATADEWKKTTDSIGQGLTDSLFRAFESGRGFFQTLWDGIKNLFQTTVLKMAFQPVQQGITNLVSGALGGSQPAYSGGAFGSAANMSSLYNAGSSLYGGGLAAYGNYAAVYSGSAYGTGFASQQSAMLAAQETGMVSGAGSSAMGSAGAVAGWAAVIAILSTMAASDYQKGFNAESAGDTGTLMGRTNEGLANVLKKIGISSEPASILSGSTPFAKLFGMGKTDMRSAGFSGTLGDGAANVSAYQNFTKKGGLFRSDQSWTEKAALDAETAKAFNDQAAAIKGAVQGYGDALGLPSEALKAVTTQLDVRTVDWSRANDPKAIQAGITAAFASYQDALLSTYGDALKSVSMAGESTQDTLARLSASIQMVNSTFETLGLHMVQTSVAGASAANDLIKLTGGMDAFMAKTQAYLGGYFSQAEQLGLGASGVLKTLRDAGIDFGGATQRQDLRSLIEELDPNVAGSREQIAALLTVAGDFARLTDYLAENALTLGQLADLAPTRGLALAEDPATRAATAAEASAATLQASNDQLTAIAAGTATGNSLLQALLATTQAANLALVEEVANLAAALDAAARMNDIAPDLSGRD